MVGLGSTPAAHVLGLGVFDEGHDDVAHQIGVARHRREPERHRRDTQADREAGVAPAELFTDDPGIAGAQRGAAQIGGEAAEVVAGLVGLAEHVPEPGLRRDHLVRRTVVQFHSGWTHDFRGEAMSLLAQLHLLRS